MTIYNKLRQKNKKHFTAEQKKFINYNGIDSILLRATAGSGKTASCVERLNTLLKRGVDPSKIIYFSFTNDAVKEFKSRIDKDIHVTTIHSFCAKLLGKFRKYSPIASWKNFINYYKRNCKPNSKSKPKLKEFANNVLKLIENGDKIQSEIANYKLLKIANVKTRVPSFIKEYSEFLYKTKKMDFSDMLIRTYKLIDSVVWKKISSKYEHIFIDEYQDTSIIQLKILLALKAKQYYLIGDRNQSIYGFGGSNCLLIEKEFKQCKVVKELTLSINFRSDIKIVNNSNTFSDLVAIPNSKKHGVIEQKLLRLVDIPNVIKKHNNIAVLVRTNKIIRFLEEKFLEKKVPLKYFNYITPKEFIEYRNGTSTGRTNQKILHLEDFYGSDEKLISFVKQNFKNKRFITTIHKSKGREFDACIVVNSLSSEILEANNLLLTDDELKKVSFDQDNVNDENKQVHYVAVTRPKNFLYYAYIDEEELNY